MGDAEDLIVAMRDLQADVASKTALFGEINDKLAKIDAELPKLVTRRKVRWVLGISGMIVVLIAGTLGVSLELNHSAVCGVRNVLVLAESATARNPLPSTLPPELLAEAQRERDQAAMLYKQGLDRLNILWPCAGETRIGG